MCGYDFVVIVDFGLLFNGVNVVKELGIEVKVGNVFIIDIFY